MEPFDLRDGGDPASSFEPTTLIASQPGQTFTARMELVAAGEMEADEILVDFYASSDPCITPSDYYLGRTSIGGTIKYSIPLETHSVFPVSIPQGTYYVGWIIDPGNLAPEADENNNIGYKSTELLRVVSPSQSTLYVDADARGANDGSSWHDALTSLPEALALAASGREIRPGSKQGNTLRRPKLCRTERKVLRIKLLR